MYHFVIKCHKMVEKVSKICFTCTHSNRTKNMEQRKGLLMWFMGEFLNKFDSAGRVSLPAKMRDELRASGLNDSLVIYYAFATKCLKIVPKSAYVEMGKTLKEKAKTSPVHMIAYRELSASAREAEINASGRISISPDHRNDAELTDECYIIGMGEHIEIWSKTNRESEKQANFAEFASVDVNELDLTIF